MQIGPDSAWGIRKSNADQRADSRDMCGLQVYSKVIMNLYMYFYMHLIYLHCTDTPNVEITEKQAVRAGVI